MITAQKVRHDFDFLYDDQRRPHDLSRLVFVQGPVQMYESSVYRDEDQIILNKNHGLLSFYPVGYRRYLGD